AGVEGYALAGGFELVLSCDLIVASEEAKFGLPEPKRGLVAAAGGVMRLPRRIPYHIAMEIALTGDFYPATRLHELGLVNRITPAGKALEDATEPAKTIAANAPLALAATKKIMVESIDWSLDEMFAKQDEITGPVFTSKDAMEGAAAFAEKRAPVWKGEYPSPPRAPAGRAPVPRGDGTPGRPRSGPAAYGKGMGDYWPSVPPP